MNQRLLKRHKRQVARARAKVNVSEPDVRTPEQLQADRDASRAVNASPSHGHATAVRSSTVPATGSTKKADG